MHGMRWGFFKDESRVARLFPEPKRGRFLPDALSSCPVFLIEVQAVHRLLPLALLASFVALGGCSIPRPRPSGAGGSLPPEPFVGSPSAPEQDNPSPLVKRPLGELAGEVTEPSRQRVANASIQVVAMDGPGAPKALFTAKSDSAGYFTIPALEKGRRYQLVARRKRGEQVWTGRVFATASNVRLVIWLTEIRPLAAETIPAKAVDPVPVPPAGVPGNEGAPPADRIAQEKKHDFDNAPPAPAVSVPGGPGPGRGDDPSRKPSFPPAPSRSEGGVTTPLQGATSPAPSETPADESPVSADKAEVPSCVRTGHTVHNFALKDYNGHDWELRKQAKGKYVLVDFWSLKCPPCIEALPKLSALQRRWGGKGLLVVGVLSGEDDAASRRKGVDAAFARKHLAFTYPVLFSEGRECPVRRELRVFVYPSLRLLDPKGRIVWEAQGFDARTAADLEYELRQRLGK